MKTLTINNGFTDIVIASYVTGEIDLSLIDNRVQKGFYVILSETEALNFVELIKQELFETVPRKFDAEK